MAVACEIGMSTVATVESLGRDFSYALRGLLRRPAFTLAAVLTCAVGIGANTAIFSVVYGVLIKPLPYPDADELVSVWHTAPGITAGDVNFSPTMYFTYLDENRTFQDLGMWSASGATFAGIGEPEQARTGWATHGALQALGVHPLLGRVFAEADDVPRAEVLPVILTHAYWQRRFGGEESVIGRTLTVNSQPAQVIGVMPADFRFFGVTPEIDAILPLRFERAGLSLGNFSQQGIARLKPGVSLEEANADVARMLPIWLDAWPSTPGGGVTRAGIENSRIAPSLRPLKTDIVGSVANMLWILMGTIGAVLLIACANVANLMLVRSEARRQEFAIRAALGARPGRIARELLVESLVLGIAGGALGLGFAYAGLELLVSIGPARLPRLQEIAIDPFVLAFAVATSLASSLLFGSIPAAKHASWLGGLNSAARSATASRERSSTRNVLVVVQVALALVLVVSSGLMIRTFEALGEVDAGFTSPEQVQTARISARGDSDRILQTQRDILEKIAALPGVESASFAYSVPMETGRVQSEIVFVEDRTYSPGETPPLRRQKYVAPGYFGTIGTRLIAGRDVTWTDIDNGGYVGVISENLAREIWGEPSAALGERIRVGASEARWREVIGVAQNVHEDALHLAPPSMVYWPIKMEGWFGDQTFAMPAINYVVRSERAGTASLVREIQQAVWSVDSNLPVFLIRTVQDLYAESLERTSFALVLLAIAGAMALALGVIGIYGVISFIVSQRKREIGIRLALGAQPAALQRMFVRQGLVLTAIGVAAGLLAAVALTRWMSSLLFGVGPLYPATYVASFAVILAAAALASFVPARRAATVDPVETLKVE
jgi:predicted permease